MDPLGGDWLVKKTDFVDIGLVAHAHVDPQVALPMRAELLGGAQLGELQIAGLV